MRVLGALLHELARVASRRRFAVAGVAMLLVGLGAIASRRTGLVSAAGTGGMVPYSGSMLWLSGLDEASVMFIAWPLVIGGTLAEDLESGLGSWLVMRTGSRRSWLLSKVAASYLASTGLLLLLASVWAVAAALLAPWDPTYAGAVVPWGSSLAASMPLALGLCVVLILGLAATATSALTMLLGSLGAGRVLSQVGAAVLYLGCMFVLPGPVNPGERAALLSTFAEWATPLSTTGYWLAVLAVVVGLTGAVLRVREVR